MKNSHQAASSHKRPSKAKKSAASGQASKGRSGSSDQSQLDADARELAQQQPATDRDQELPAEDAVETSGNAENGSIERDSTHELPVAKGRHAQKRSASSAPSKRSSSETADS